jgi:hypothetical protein
MILENERGGLSNNSLFKQLSRTIIEYANHPEAKFDGDMGVLERKHIVADSIIYIGKEANNINEQDPDVKKKG